MYCTLNVFQLYTAFILKQLLIKVIVHKSFRAIEAGVERVPLGEGKHVAHGSHVVIQKLTPYSASIFFFWVKKRHFYSSNSVP